MLLFEANQEGRTVILRSTHENLESLLEDVRDFLQACGFYIPNQLDQIEDDEAASLTELRREIEDLNERLEDLSARAEADQQILDQLRIAYRRADHATIKRLLGE